MYRMGIIVLGSLMLLSSQAGAQQPSRIGLRVELKGKLRNVCVPAGGTVDEVEQGLTAALVQKVKESEQWKKFCWKIESFDPSNMPQGILKVTLEEVPTDIAEVNVTISAGAVANTAPPFPAFKLLEGVGTNYPRGKMLADKLNFRFSEACLEPSENVERLHQLLRSKVPVGTGMVIHNFPAAPDDQCGIILLPWDEFKFFGEAMFKFRYLTPASLEELESKGAGRPDTVTLQDEGRLMCCLLTKHKQKPVMPPEGPVDVYLDIDYQRILVLPPAAVPSCSSSDSGTTIVPFSP